MEEDILTLPIEVEVSDIVIVEIFVTDIDISLQTSSNFSGQLNMGRIEGKLFMV